MNANTTRRGGWDVVLGVLAGALAVLLGLELLRAPEAHAGLVSRAGGLTVLTAGAGNEDVLVVLDERNEMLLTYCTDPRLGLQLMQKIPLQELFREARARSLGTP
jgi:hypothetical protein